MAKWTNKEIGQAIKYGLDVALYQTQNALLYIRFFAVIKCPCCEGKGGCVEGYYEPEWTECRVCSFAWDYDEKRFFYKLACDREFEGMISPSKWLKYKVALSGLSWVRIIKCKLGYHAPFSKEEPVCGFCYKTTTKPIAS